MSLDFIPCDPVDNMLLWQRYSTPHGKIQKDQLAWSMQTGPMG